MFGGAASGAHMPEPLCVSSPRIKQREQVFGLYVGIEVELEPLLSPTGRKVFLWFLDNDALVKTSEKNKKWRKWHLDVSTILFVYKRKIPLFTLQLVNVLDFTSQHQHIVHPTSFDNELLSNSGC